MFCVVPFAILFFCKEDIFYGKSIYFPKQKVIRVLIALVVEGSKT